MMGKDSERIFSSIDKMISVTAEAINDIAKLNSPPIKVKADHTHSDEGAGPASKTFFIEKEDKKSMAGPLNKVISTLEGLADDLGKMDELKEGLYTDTTSFNNSIGSPWREIERLRSFINEVSSWSGEDYIGDRAAVIALLTSVQTAAVDAKWAFMLYNDYIQRGFDHRFNDNEPSITFPKNFKENELDPKRSIGNKNQEFDENVHIKQGNYDPF